jgi:hypothetical protein
MNVGRPMPRIVKRMIRPYGRLCWPVFFFAIVLILWGAAWLPGGQLVEWPGIFLLAGNVVYRVVRFALALALAHRYRQPRPSRGGLLGRPYASAFLLMALGGALAADLPFKLVFACAKPRLYRLWAVDPAPMGRLEHVQIGPFYIEQGEVNPNRIYLWVAWAGVIDVDPEKGQYICQPLPTRVAWWELRER